MLEVKSNELVKVVNESGLEKQTANNLLESFAPFFEQAQDWKEKAESLIVTDVSQVREMQMAKQARLALKDIRVQADKTRKALKEDSIRYGKAVQGVYNVIEYVIAPIEEYLEQQEKFPEIQEAKRKAEIKAVREIELEPYQEFIPHFVDFGAMSDEDYSKLLNGAKLQLQAKLDAEAKAEAERIERERKKKAHIDRQYTVRDYGRFFDWDSSHEDLSDEEFSALIKKAEKAKSEYEAEQEKIRQENERLRKEAEAKEKALEAERKANEEKARKEREAQGAQLKAEREAREKIEAELRAKQAAEEKARIEAENAEKQRQLEAAKAAKAPKKQKLNNWVDSFSVGWPDGLVDDKTVIDISQKFDAFKKWAKTQIENI